jgi:WD40 repeat protein
VLEIATGREVLSHAHGYDVVSFAFSPDGARVVAAGRSATLTVWDATTGQVVLTLPVVAAGQVEAVAFSPDGSRLSTGAYVWDAATGKELFLLLGHTRNVSRIAFNANGTRLITGSYDGTARIWDLTLSHEVFTLPHEDMVYGVAFSPDGKLLATTSADKTAILWDVASGQVIRTLSGHAEIVNSVAFSPDGKLLATTSADKTSIVWDVASGRVLRTLTGHADDRPGAIPHFRGVMAAAFSPLCVTSSGVAAERCPLATVGFDGQLIVWDALTGEKLITYQDEIGGLKSVAFSPGGNLLAVGNTGEFSIPFGAAALLDAASGEVLRTLPSHPGWVWGLAFTPDGKRLASVNFNGAGEVWDVATGEALVSLKGLTSGFSVAFSPDGTHIATGNGEGIVNMWDAQSGLLQFPLTGHTAPVASLAFSPDGKYLAAASLDKAARVYVVPPEDLLALAESRVTRTLTEEECQQYLHGPCPEP